MWPGVRSAQDKCTSAVLLALAWVLGSFFVGVLVFLNGRRSTFIHVVWYGRGAGLCMWERAVGSPGLRSATRRVPAAAKRAL